MKRALYTYYVKSAWNLDSDIWDSVQVFKPGLWAKRLSATTFKLAVEDAQKPNGYHYRKIALFKGEKELKRWMDL